MTEAHAPGQHLLIDFWGGRQPTDIEDLERLLRETAAACGATVLGVNLHHFGERHGITGVAMLSESHISLHSWPELDYIALDIFLCGNRNPEPALALLHAALRPTRAKVVRHARGLPDRGDAAIAAGSRAEADPDRLDAVSG